MRVLSRLSFFGICCFIISISKYLKYTGVNVWLKCHDAQAKWSKISSLHMVLYLHKDNIPGLNPGID